MKACWRMWDKNGLRSMTTRISKEEKAIIDYVEGNNSTSVNDLYNEINRYAEIVRTQMCKHDGLPFVRTIRRAKVNL